MIITSGLHSRQDSMMSAIDNSREILEMRKTCKARETRKKKGLARDNMKVTTHFLRIDYILVQLFYLLSHEKIPLSHA